MTIYECDFEDDIAPYCAMDHGISGWRHSVSDVPGLHTGDTAVQAYVMVDAQQELYGQPEMYVYSWVQTPFNWLVGCVVCNNWATCDDTET